MGAFRLVALRCRTWHLKHSQSRKPKTSRNLTGGQPFGGPPFWPLLVSQGFDGIKPRGLDSGQHPADQADNRQDDGGNDHDRRVDNEPDVGRLSVLGDSAVEGNPPDSEGNRIGQENARYAAGKRDGHRFRKELEQDVAPAAAQRLFHADLARTLGDRDQHDVHQADPADAQRKRADEGQQNLQPCDDDIELFQLLHHVVDEHRTFVVGLEVVLLGQHSAHLVLDKFVVITFVVEPDAVKIMRVLQVAHGGEGNVDNLIDVVIAFLHVRRKNSNHLEANAVNPDELPQCVLAGEQLGLRLRANDGHPPAGHLVRLVQQAALAEMQGQDLEHAGINTLDGKRIGANILLHIALLFHHRRDAMDKRRGVHDAVNVVEGELDLGTGLLSPGLLRRASGKDAYGAGAPVGEDGLNSAAESRSISQQKYNGRNAPGHAEHGERSAAAIMAHRAVGLRKQILYHGYSCLSASTGCSRDALRAG